MPAPTHDGRRVVLHLGLAVALLAAPLSALLSTWYFTLTFFGERSYQVDHEQAWIATAAVTALTAGLELVVLVLLRPHPWVLLLAAAGLLAMLALVADTRSTAATAGPDPDDPDAAVEREQVTDAVLTAMLYPNQWPLLAFAVGGTVVRVRARSSRARRAPRDRSSAPAGPR